MSSSNASDRRDFDLGASQNAQDNFNAVAARLEALLDQRDNDVKQAMADYQADGSSEEYAAKEARWNRVGAEVRSIITTLQGSLASNDQAAQGAMQRAKAAVDSIG